MKIKGRGGYAKGGVVSQDAQDLADLAASGMPLGADAEMLEEGLKADDNGPSQDARDLADIAGSGMPLAGDADMLEAGLKEARGYAEGGMVTGQEEAAQGEKDPTEIPEDIREFVEAAHKAMRESRPDESWRIAPTEKPESIAPYKRDAEETTGAVAAYSSGGQVPGYDEGGEMPDPNKLMADIAPMGTGTLVPSPAPQTAVQPPIPPPAPSAMPAPVSAAPKAPAMPDQDFTERANKMLGLNPEQQAGFMKLLGNNAQKAQIGAGIAGIGDAIASGGTLGKVNPGALARSEDLINGRTKEGLEGLQTIRGNQKESYDLGEKLRGNEPFSPQIQKSLVTQFHIPPALSGAPRDVIYKMLDPIAQTQLKEAELAAQESFKKASIDIQKQTLDATKANQTAERANAAKETGLKADTEAAKHYVMHPELAAAARQRLAAGTSGVSAPDGRITVVSPSGQVGHIPESQLQAAMAKGYRKQ